jgi:hypothetical protein
MIKGVKKNKIPDKSSTLLLRPEALLILVILEIR